MTKILESQEQFNGGEFSPRMYGRTDLAQYSKGLETMTNAKATIHGPAIRRSGTKYVAHTKTAADTVKLLRFQFSKDDGVIIEAGNQYFRFYANSGQVTESSQNITGITQANPGVVTITGHGYSNGDHVYIESVGGMTEVNDSNIPYIVANKTANTFELTDYDGNNVNTTGFTAYSSGGISTKIYELSTPWDATEVQDLSYAQFGDLLYVAHPDYEPRVITRASNSSWSISTLSASPPATFEAGEEPSTTCTPAATTGTGVNFTTGAATWLDSDVGRQIVNLSTGETGIAIITSITSTTVAVCDIVEDFTDTNAIASGDWKLDLSPICDLDFEGTSAGSIVTVRSRYPVGYLDTSATISGVTKANPGVVTTSSSHGFVDGDEVTITDVVGMTDLNNNTYRVNNKTSTTFELQGTNTTNFVTYASGGTARILQEDNLRDAFRTTDVGRYIVVNGGIMKIIARNSATSVDCEVLKSLTTDDRTGNWTLEDEAWSATRGYPRAVGIFQERLIFGGTSTQPQTIWLSETGIFDGFGVGTADADAIEVTLGTSQVNQINWIAASRDIIVGTAGGELTLNGGSTGSNITPGNISQIPRTYHGSQRQQPITVGDEVLFLQSAGRKVRTFRFDFNIDNYRGEDLIFIAEHISEGGINEVAYAQEPDSIIHAVTTNGDLLTGTYSRFQEVVAWSRYQTDGDFENVQAISEGEEDQVWVVVERVINSNTRRYIEFFDNGDGQDDLDGFSDSYLTLSSNLAITNITQANPAVVTSASHGLSNGDKIIIKDLVDPASVDLDVAKTNMSSLNNCTFTVANKTANTFELSGINTSAYNAYSSGGNAWLKVTSITGLDSLEGKTVQIKTDGAAHPNKTVSSGAITLDRPAGEIVIGLPYTTTLKTLRKNFDIGLGTMQGQRVRHMRPVIRVYRSAKPLLNGQIRPGRSSADNMDKKVPLFSGDIFYGPEGWDTKGQLSITQSDPFPLQLQGIFGAIEGGIK